MQSNPKKFSQQQGPPTQNLFWKFLRVFTHSASTIRTNSYLGVWLSLFPKWSLFLISLTNKMIKVFFIRSYFFSTIYLSSFLVFFCFELFRLFTEKGLKSWKSWSSVDLDFLPLKWFCFSINFFQKEKSYLQHSALLVLSFRKMFFLDFMEIKFFKVFKIFDDIIVYW